MSGEEVCPESLVDRGLFCQPGPSLMSPRHPHSISISPQTRRMSSAIEESSGGRRDEETSPNSCSKSPILAHSLRKSARLLRVPWIDLHSTASSIPHLPLSTRECIFDCLRTCEISLPCHPPWSRTGDLPRVSMPTTTFHSI